MNIEDIINLNRRFFLDNKDYIKKYYKIREIHSSVLNSMIDYVSSSKNSFFDESYGIICDDVKKETENLEFYLDSDNFDDCVIINELFFYKTHPKLTSLAEIYIKKSRFKSTSKSKMLYAMRDSIVGLFKIVDYDHMNGYVIYEDVFTNKRYKVIDISLSSVGPLNKDIDLYFYNRIITYEDITFGSGLPCLFTGTDKRLQKFITKYKHKNISDFSKCLILYSFMKSGDDKLKLGTYLDY